MNLTRRSMFTLTAAALLAGCGPMTVDPDPSTFSVAASITSVTLADNCPTSAAPGAAQRDCAEAPAADAGAGRFAPCGGYCRQSSMQMQLVAGAGTRSARVEVLSVRLLDAATNAPLETLVAREPTAWNDTTSVYAPWDQSIAADTTRRVQYKLSAPNWGAHSLESSRYSRRYRLEVVIRIGGVSRTIRSNEVMREPEVVT